MVMSDGTPVAEAPELRPESIPSVPVPTFNDRLQAALIVFGTSRSAMRQAAQMQMEAVETTRNAAQALETARTAETTATTQVTEAGTGTMDSVNGLIALLEEFKATL